MSIVTHEQALEILDNYAADDPLTALREYADCLSEYRLDMCAIAEPAAALAHAWNLLTPARQAYCVEAARAADLNRYVPDRLAPERRKAIEIVRGFGLWEPSRSPPASNRARICNGCGSPMPEGRADPAMVLLGLPTGCVSPPAEGRAMTALALRACTVEPIGRVEAVSVIIRYEHLGTMGNASLFFGLRSPEDSLLSVVGFGHGAHGSGTAADIVLERGWTHPDAPRNSGSYLIARALRYGRRVLGWRVVRAYSDERFGEAGILYKAAGFVPAPPTKHPNRFRWGLRDGDRVLSDRAIYRRHGSLGAARDAGAQLVQLPLRIAWEWRASP